MNHTAHPMPVQSPALIKSRDPKVAAKLSRSCPGLGHIYAGDIRRGLLFLAAVDLPLVLGALVLVAPWGNLWVTTALWIISAAVTLWSFFDARKVVLSTRSDYRMKDYNHWIVYVVIGVIPTLAVAMATAVAIRSTILQATSAASDLPEIGVAQGDFFVESTAAYRDRKPAKGDLIVYRGPLGSGQRFIGRIVGLPGDPSVSSQGAPPPGFLEVTRAEGERDSRIISEMSVTGKLTYRFWPPSRLGRVGENPVAE